MGTIICGERFNAPVILELRVIRSEWRIRGNSPGSRPRNRSASGEVEIAQREFQAAVFGVIVVADRERDIDGIARQERYLLQAVGHMPAESIESDFSSQFSILSSQ